MLFSWGTWIPKLDKEQKNLMLDLAGTRNDRGNRLIELFDENNFVITRIHGVTIMIEENILGNRQETDT